LARRCARRRGYRRACASRRIWPTCPTSRRSSLPRWVADRYATDRIHLLFNKAGIGGGGSLIVNRCEEWERTFNVCWGSVDDGTRALLPLLLKAEECHIDELVRRSLERA
jgi:NAD(P)-dependent dehydrogenase (short-subunit alcohol dehydrogenase family)